MKIKHYEFTTIFIMKQIIPYLIIAILAVLLFRQCEQRKHDKITADNTAQFLKDSVRYYKNEIGQEVAVRTALQGKRDALQTLLDNTNDENGQLRRLLKNAGRVDGAGNITIITRIDSIPVPYEVPIPCKFHRDWNAKDEFYSISGVSNQNGIVINSIEIPNRLSFVMGEKKGNFTIQAVNSNPNVKTIGLDAYSFKVPPKRFGVSIFAGYGISNEGLSPLVGIGLGYQLIRF